MPVLPPDDTSPLKGLRVLDFSKVLAGPLCGQYLADLGADVTKVEPVDRGDDTRTWPPFHEDLAEHRDGTVFLSANRGKRSLSLDLKTDEGQEVLERLLAQTDVVLESYSPAAAERLGLDARTLLSKHERLIHCSITGFGPRGPLRFEKGYDVILQAFTGMMALTGNAGDPPLRIPFSPIDQVTGYHALIGILAALLLRERTGKGSAVDASLFDSSASLVGYLLQAFWRRGTEPSRLGSGHESLCPYQAFDTLDKPIMLGIANDSLWHRFCEMARATEYASDPRLCTNADRVRNRQLTISTTSRILAGRKRDEWIADLSAAGIPCSPIHTLQEFSEHPQFTRSGARFTYSHPAYGEVPAIAAPIALNGIRPTAAMPPPLLGQHSVEILKELGYDDAFIARLARAGTISAPGPSTRIVPHCVDSHRPSPDGVPLAD